MRSDLGLFLTQLLRRPGEVVALAPSSGALARAMAEGLGPDTGRVAELGPGTGKITRAILAQGVAAADLTLIEMNRDFATLLRGAFPGVAVHRADAQDIAALTAPGLGAVVSGLPLLSLPVAVQRAILTGAFAHLRPGGTFVQFTYGPKPPLATAVQQELGLTATRGPRIWGNLPPARVYAYRRVVN